MVDFPEPLGAQSITNFLTQYPMQITNFPTSFTGLYYAMLLIASDFVNITKPIKFLCVIGVLALILVAKIIPSTDYSSQILAFYK
jgi:hypothetical protein